MYRSRLSRPTEIHWMALACLAVMIEGSCIDRRTGAYFAAMGTYKMWSCLAFWSDSSSTCLLDPCGAGCLTSSGYLDVECKVVECQYDGFFHGAHYRVGRDRAWAIFDADLPFQSAPYNTVLPVGGKVHCIAIGDTSQIYRSSYDGDFALLILRKSQASPGLFERVGLCKDSSSDLWKKLFETASWRRLMIV